MFDVIVAYDLSNGICYQGDLPWHFKKDLKYFMNITKSRYENKIQQKNREIKPNVLIMGRKTFDSLPKLLSDRYHIVLSSNAHTLNAKNTNHNSVTYINSLSDIIDVLHKESINRMNLNNKYLDHNNKIFIIGGSNIYETILNKYTEHILSMYVTHVYRKYECDTFFPNIDEYNEFKEDETYSQHYEEKNTILCMKCYLNSKINKV